MIQPLGHLWSQTHLGLRSALAMRLVLQCLALIAILPHGCPVLGQTWRHLAAPDTATYTEFDRITTRANDGTVPRETVFRIRTETVAFQPRLDDAINAYRPRFTAETPAERRIRAVLDRTVEEITFDEAPLADAVMQIGQTLGISIRLHMSALDDVALDPEEPVTLHVRDMSGHAMLANLLDDLDLVGVIRHESLLITTREDAEENPVVAEYPVPLIGDLDSLVTLIQQTVAPATWNAVGGIGSIQADAHGTRLFISQTEEVHREIAAILEGFLDPDPQPPAEADAGRERRGRSVRVYHIPNPVQRDYLNGHLLDLCNEALAHEGDPDATVTLVDEQLLVQSRAAAFHCYAAQVIRAIVGDQISTVEAVSSTSTVILGTAGMGTGGAF